MASLQCTPSAAAWSRAGRRKASRSLRRTRPSSPPVWDPSRAPLAHGSPAAVDAAKSMSFVMPIMTVSPFSALAGFESEVPCPQLKGHTPTALPSVVRNPLGAGRLQSRGQRISRFTGRQAVLVAELSPGLGRGLTRVRSSHCRPLAHCLVASDGHQR